MSKQCTPPKSSLQIPIKANVSILEKRYNLFDGIGYMCEKSKITVITHKTWKNEENQRDQLQPRK